MGRRAGREATGNLCSRFASGAVWGGGGGSGDCGGGGGAQYGSPLWIGIWALELKLTSPGSSGGGATMDDGPNCAERVPGALGASFPFIMAS